MARPSHYIGINNDLNGGMTPIGRMIRDAWVFGLIEETETCEGWDMSRINALLQRVNTEWDKYGCLFSHLPEDLAARHRRIHDEGFKKAQAAGWSGEVETEEDK